MSKCDVTKFTVLMTVYEKEKPEFFDKALESILINQTVKPDQFVLVYDGPVPAELEAVTEKYKQIFPNKFDIVALPENLGQGGASKAGFALCENDLLARMDSDDIAYPERFEKELAVFAQDKSVDVVGGHITEFVGEPENITGVRATAEAHEEILEMFKRRNPVNNVTVMYKKKALEDIGGYSESRANEDFNIYVRLVVAGKRFYNIQEPMVNVRVGENMLERRGDINIYHAWKNNQKILYKGGITKFYEYFMNCFGCYCFVKCPKFVKKFLYKFILRK